jgi:hypothetical protein
MMNATSSNPRFASGSRPQRGGGADPTEECGVLCGPGLGGLIAERSVAMLNRKSTAEQRHPQSNLVAPDSLRQAFTRVELLACLAALASLAALALPALAATQSHSQLVQCLNNLRLIGRGVQMWGSDHGNQVSWRTAVLDGGSYQTPKTGAAWFEYAHFSNELATPRILACPADGANVSREWSGPGGYTTSSILGRAAATSYSLNLEARSEDPLAPVCTDRNIRFTPGATACSAGVNNADAINLIFPFVGWTNSVHGRFGNIVTIDGSTATTTSEELGGAIRRSEDNSQVHFLRAR